MRVPDSQRVAITGIGITSPVGNDPDSAFAALRQGRSGIRRMPAWEQHEGLGPRIAGVVEVDAASVIPRKYRRSMGRVAQLSAYATKQAVDDAGLTEDLLRGGRLGLAIGSTTGSPSATLDYYANLFDAGVRANKGTAFLQSMSHTCAANMALMLGVVGRVWGPNSACASASQAIGLGYETVRAGAQDVMICGGAEEVHYTTAATFDLVAAASTAYNDRPHLTPRPFDAERDGMVAGEGAGVLVLERWDHAVARGRRIYAEVIGFATTCDGEHITTPAEQGMASCMRAALAGAGLEPDAVDYINAHATGTVMGDVTEARATAGVFGERVPVSSTKGYTGHTLGACGGIESIFAIQMLRRGVLVPNLNLDRVDPQCAGIQLLTAPLERRVEVALNNNFAFGGINTSLLFRRVDG